MTLDAYLKAKGIGELSRLARAVGVGPSMVSKWRYGRVVPSLAQALDIKRATRGKVRERDLIVDTKQSA